MKTKRKKVDKKRKRPIIVAAPYIILAIIVLIWELAVAVFKIPPTVFPSLSAIVIETIKNFPTNIAYHFWITLRTAGLGMLVSVPLGILLAAVISQFKPLTYGTTPIILVLVVTPLITLVPLFMLWLGFDYQPRYIVVAVSVTPIILLNTLHGFLQVPQKYRELMRGYGASKLQTFVKVIFPNALPQVFTGIELGGIISTVATTSIEMVAGTPGLGYRVMYFSRLLQTDLVFGTIFCIAIIGVALYSVAAFAANKVVHWQ